LVISPDQIQAPALPTPPVASEQMPLLPQPAKTTLSNPESSRSTFFIPDRFRRSAQYLGGLSFVTIAGLTAWWIAGRKDGPGGGEEEVFDWTSQAFGWASAILYSEYSAI
jgi:hypothetical protein